LALIKALLHSYKSETQFIPHLSEYPGRSAAGDE